MFTMILLRPLHLERVTAHVQKVTMTLAHYILIYCPSKWNDWIDEGVKHKAPQIVLFHFIKNNKILVILLTGIHYFCVCSMKTAKIWTRENFRIYCIRYIIR